MSLKVYGSHLCPHCVACKKAFDEAGINAEYFDITLELKNLKEFLSIRDKSELFDEARANKGIGIPCIIKEDGTMTLDFESLLASKRTEVKSGAACSLDGKDC